MAEAISGQIAINNGASVSLTFDRAISSVIMWSADDSFYVNFDGDAANTHFLHPEDSPIAYGVPCKSVGLLAQNDAAAIVMYIGIYRITGQADSDPGLLRGGIDV